MPAFFKILKSRRFWFIAIAVLGACFAVWYSDIWINTTGPIGGWEEIKTQIEKKYADNEDAKNAALQLGEVLQKAIDYPSDAKMIEPEVSVALACLWAVEKLYGINEVTDNIEAILTSSSSRQRRYIKYNVNLSGGVYPGVARDLSKCKFKVVGPKK